MNDLRTRGSSRGWLCALAALGMLATSMTASGCGDGPICQAEILVIIRSPNGIVLTDSNAAMDGLQTDVRISSTAGEGQEIVLTVLGEDDEELGTATAVTDADGDVVIEDVDLPVGAVALRAALDAGECGSDEDEISLEIAAGDGCELALRQEPLENDFYAPLDVLNQSVDTDGDVDDFQGDVDVAAAPGAEVELFVIDANGIEASAGTETADDEGVASFAVTLGQGRQSLRAVCSTGALASPSVTTSVFVDTVGPDCSMGYPAAGSSITPGMDDDDDLSNGVQLTLTGLADGGDTEGEAAEFVVTVDGTSTTLAGTDVDEDGVSNADADFDPADDPADATVAFSSQDHAGNACDLEEAYQIVYDGCDIAVVAPTGVETVDADGNAANGVQVDIDLDVDVACAGRTVTSDCGLNDPMGTVAGDGSLTLRADWCAGASCDVTDDCTFTVSNTAGIETTAAQSIRFDNQAPATTVQVSAPVTACGGQIAPSQDQSGDPGVQVRVTVTAPTSTSRALDHTTGAGTTTTDVTMTGGEALVTLASGVNSFVGRGTDAQGNVGTSPACAITLVDIAVGFSPPAADGSVGASDGTVSGSDLTFNLCGTVSETGTTVGVTVDGGASLPAVVSGTTWCVSITVAASPPTHTIVATATSGPRTGNATLILTVDLSAPTGITGLTVVADSRHSLLGSWTAPSDGGGPAASYLVKVSTTALTEANFDTTGTAVSAPTPGTPGSTDTLRVSPRRTGVAYWYGVAAVDGGGNRGPAAIVGPVTPVFDATAAITPPDTGGDAGLGFASAHGRFNDDAFDDVAVAAPFVTIGGVSGAGAVYVYFGSASGIDSTPDVVIAGVDVDGAFGTALAAVRWSSTTRDDLVVGAPFGDNVNGRVYVFDGGAGFTAGSIDAGDADLVIGVSSVDNYFTGSALGFSLAALDFDGDGTDDLAMGAVAGGTAFSGDGGVAILYGGTASGATVTLHDTDASGMNGAIVHLIDDPNGVAFDLFGQYVFNLGPTAGAADQNDDLAISYADGTPSVYIYRGTGTRPVGGGVHARAFTVGQDVRFDYTSADLTLETGSSVASIADLNADGARDIVIGIPEEFGALGRVLIIDGNTTGTAGIALWTVPGVVITDIQPAAGISLFGTGIVNNATSPGADVDGDGQEDLLITGKTGGIITMYVWFGGTIPVGLGSTTSAGHVITGPATFTGNTPSNGGTNVTAGWAGDVNGDGLTDISWCDAVGNGLDGSFQVLWDDGN